MDRGYILLITVYAFVIGACMGSFLNCAAFRIVHGESFLKGRSHCDSCGHVLGFPDLIPIVSFLIFRGRCRYCGAKLSAGFLLSELVSALVFVSVAHAYGISFQTLEALLFCSVLLACSFADLEGYIIPDGFIILGIAVRFVFILFSGSILPQLVYSLIGGFALAGGLLLVVLAFEKLMKKEAMGGGDIKLIFLIGLYLGWKRTLLCLLLSCFVGIAFALLTRKKSDRPFPFGPSISLAAWLCLLFGDRLIAFYIGLF